MLRVLIGKEFRETYRDRRVLVSVVLMPVLLIALFIYLFGILQNTMSKPMTQRVAIVGRNPSDQIQKAFTESKLVEFVPAKDLEQAKRIVRSGKAKAIFAMPENGMADLASGQSMTITVYTDTSEPLSVLPAKVLRDVADRLNQGVAEKALESQGLPKALAAPIQVVEKPLESDKGMGASMVLSMLPYLVVIWAFYGGFSIAADVLAGEKERQTLETLLISPATRTELALSKFIVLLAVCLTGSIATFLAVYLVGISRLPGTELVFPNGPTFGWKELGGVAMVLIPLSALFAAVLLAFSALAKNIREAQTHLTLVSFVVLMPAVYSQFIDITGDAKAPWVKFTPILNASVCIKQALSQRLDSADLLATVLTSAVLAGLAILWAVKLINREQVLSRT